jgi:type III secretion protein L
VYSATEEAQQILERAQHQAAAILADAETRRDVVLDEARKTGEERGLARWNIAVANVLAERERYFEGGEAELLKLSIKIAQKIIGQELQLSPGTIAAIVREALKSARRNDELTIQVNPAQIEDLRARISSIQEEFGSTRSIHVVESHAISPGGCIIVSDAGSIDAQLETQLAHIETLLLGHWRR